MIEYKANTYVGCISNLGYCLQPRLFNIKRIGLSLFPLYTIIECAGNPVKGSRKTLAQIFLEMFY